MDSPRPLYVTEPHLPALAKYQGYMERIWETRQLTNHGPLVSGLERRVQGFLGLSSPILALGNGGLALQLAIKALDVRGHVITTPFTYVATASCPLWEGCSIGFADIEPDSLTLDPAAVEAAITPATEAIVSTHVYGNPCDVHALEAIANRHGLALIYDAAHAFGVRYEGRSLLEFGDVSVLSSHATKLFHTIEGGFTYARDPQVHERIEWMRRYAHDGAGGFHGAGINAKLSEFHAAMGLLVLEDMPSILDARRRICARYDAMLADHPFVRPAFQPRPGTEWNYGYYAVLFDTEARLVEVLEFMNTRNIFPRRYFDTSLNLIPSIGDAVSCPIAESMSTRALCLPLADSFTDEEIDRVIAAFQATSSAD